MRFVEEGREWSLPGLLYADQLVSCTESIEELKVKMRHFVEVCGRRGLKAIADKLKENCE